jgi:ribonuclease E
MNHILINATHKEEVRVAVVKDKKLTNLNIETTLNQKQKGNIYKGKISRIEQSLEAAFVDYGKERQGFLPFKEVAEAANLDKKLSITDVLKEGQEIIVQVSKEERGSKGAALSTFINLAGVYMILTPNSSISQGISRQINNNDRNDLKKIIGQITLPDNAGLIIRTAGAGKSLDELQWEVDYLSDLWKSIQKAAETKKAPFLIYKESDLIIRTLRDHLREDTDSVIIDEANAFTNAKDFISFVIPHYLDRIKFFDTTEHSLFNHMGIETQARSVFNREVSLQSGATLVFDTTEALTSIDINSARATKGSDIEETAFNTNLEATREIATQLQLRDIGGLIVIDFIDMSSDDHKKKIVDAMLRETNSDRARVQIGNISQFGLLEMSRQRLLSSVTESVEKTCPQCSGRGTTPTIPSLALSILRQLEDGCNASHETQRLTIQSTVEVITYLLNEKRDDILRLEQKHDIKIILLPNPYMSFPNFSINKQKSDKTSQQLSFQGVSKPQHSLAENGLNDIPEEAIVNITRPDTQKPKPKKSFFETVLGGIFSKKETTEQKKSNNNRNRRRNYKKPNNRKRPNNRRPNNQNNNQNSENRNTENKKPVNKKPNNKPVKDKPVKQDKVEQKEVA